MSLDVYLKTETPVYVPAGSGIFVRKEGRTVEISRAEWDELNPGREPVAMKMEGTLTTDVYSDNITHNLNRMAKECGLYDALWRPDEKGWTKARDILAPMMIGLTKLRDDPDHFKQWNPDNKWGTYEALIQFTRNYIEACSRYPDAIVSVWR